MDAHPNTADLVNLLWFDDDLRPKGEGPSMERLRLQHWLRYFYTGDRPTRIRLIEVRDLRSFRLELESRADHPAGHPEHIDAFLIDLLWRSGGQASAWTFGELDAAFSNERVLPLDAGAQLIGLMRNPRYRAVRPPWMSRFEAHPIAVLTTMIDHHESILLHIDNGVAGDLKVLVKQPPQEGSQDPDHDFCDWVCRLTRRCAS